MESECGTHCSNFIIVLIQTILVQVVVISIFLILIVLFAFGFRLLPIILVAVSSVSFFPGLFLFSTELKIETSRCGQRYRINSTSYLVILSIRIVTTNVFHILTIHVAATISCANFDFAKFRGITNVALISSGPIHVATSTKNTGSIFRNCFTH